METAFPIVSERPASHRSRQRGTGIILGLVPFFFVLRRFGQSFIQNALAEIKNRLLKSLLLLEEEFGCLDELGIDAGNQPSSKIERVNYEINSDVLHIQVDPPVQKVPEANVIARPN